MTPCSKAPHLPVFWTLPGAVISPLPWAYCPSRQLPVDGWLKSCFIPSESEFVVKVSGCCNLRESTKFHLQMQPVPSWCRDLLPFCNATASVAFCGIIHLLSLSLSGSCTVSLSLLLFPYFYFSLPPISLAGSCLLSCGEAFMPNSEGATKDHLLVILFCLGTPWVSKACLLWGIWHFSGVEGVRRTPSGRAVS